ncbi:uncharacterized protein Osi24 isoform X2 [Periplaneta americana]|uniref:uncharacterized protein Osi24 isoform X2 n=1 Tax=Periplaneta americana TaxID=6978 RepID=UPI0037E76356
MDRPLQIQRRKHPSRFLITTLTLLVSLSTLTACATQELSKTDSNVHNSHRTITNDKYNKTKDIFHQNDSETWTTNTEQSLVTNKSSFLTDSDWNSSKFSAVSLLKTVSTLKENCWHSNEVVKCARDTVMRIMRDILISPDSYEISNDVRLNEGDNDRSNDIFDGKILHNAGKNLTALQEIVLKRLRDYEVKVNLPLLVDRVEESARAAFSWFKPGAGKSSFLTGFGLGFLAFGLKKLLLPIFLGAQIVKSVLIAMFLPSILGGLGKLVGKGVSTFASASGSSGPSNNNMEDFDFKDNMGFDSTDSATADSKFSAAFTYPEAYGGLYQNALTGLPAGTLPAAALYMPSGAGSIKYQTHTMASPKVSYAADGQHHYGSYYTRNQQPTKKQDYKVFHNIPTSSLLLTNYDPFYSPLLSRLDSVFKQLGYESESCRERLVCAMYNNPAKFAPYSNLVSAQLSRELNELRKPSTDNPEILRFFRYMKAAKDGQDGQDCIRLHPGCSSSGPQSGAHPPMIKTYHDINKLVQARSLGKSIAQEHSSISTGAKD